MTEPLLGRYEAATLLAVDGANGGTLAGIEQIFETFERLFQRRPTASQSAASLALLCDAGLVEYTEGELGLTSRGRKLLRHTGLPGSPDRPGRVADLLGDLEEEDLAAAGSVPAPSERDIEAALNSLEADDAGDAALRTGAEVALPQIGAPLTFGFQAEAGVPWTLGGQGQVDPVAGRRLMFRRHAHGPPDGPMVAPDAADEDIDDDAPEDPPS
jgi:hypothetical protein